MDATTPVKQNTVEMESFILLLEKFVIAEEKALSAMKIVNLQYAVMDNLTHCR